MENNEPRDNAALFAEAAITCWERAVYHAERAEQMMVNLHLIMQQGRAAIEEQQAVAAAYLGLGGYGGDAAAYAELNIPYDDRDTEGYQ